MLDVFRLGLTFKRSDNTCLPLTVACAITWPSLIVGKLKAGGMKNSEDETGTRETEPRRPDEKRSCR